MDAHALRIAPPVVLAQAVLVVLWLTKQRFLLIRARGALFRRRRGGQWLFPWQLVQLGVVVLGDCGVAHPAAIPAGGRRVLALVGEHAVQLDGAPHIVPRLAHARGVRHGRRGRALVAHEWGQDGRWPHAERGPLANPVLVVADSSGSKHTTARGRGDGTREKTLAGALTAQPAHTLFL